jgi:hypothetical protein
LRMKYNLLIIILAGIASGGNGQLAYSTVWY